LLARGHWTDDYHGNLSSYSAGVYDNWVSGKSKAGDTDSRRWFHDLRKKSRIHRGHHRKSRHHGGTDRRWTMARRRTGRHVKQSVNDVWDHEQQVREKLQMPTSCAELPCSGSARCVVDQRTGHARCRCPLGTAGIHCEQGQCMSRRNLIIIIAVYFNPEQTISVIAKMCLIQFWIL